MGCMLPISKLDLPGECENPVWGGSGRAGQPPPYSSSVLRYFEDTDK